MEVFSAKSQRNRYLDEDSSQHFSANVPAAVCHRRNDMDTAFRCLAAFLIKQVKAVAFYAQLFSLP